MLKMFGHVLSCIGSIGTSDSIMGNASTFFLEMQEMAVGPDIYVYTFIYIHNVCVCVCVCVSTPTFRTCKLHFDLAEGHERVWVQHDLTGCNLTISSSF